MLKPRPTGTVWKRGAEATVRFQLTANHGGGCELTSTPVLPFFVADATVQPTGSNTTCLCVQISTAFAPPARRNSQRPAFKRPRWRSPTRRSRCFASQTRRSTAGSTRRWSRREEGSAGCATQSPRLSAPATGSSLARRLATFRCDIIVPPHRAARLRYKNG